VLGVPHPAVNTRDVALYQPFRNALRSHNQLVRLPTLTFHLMGRRCQEGQQNPVRLYILFDAGMHRAYLQLACLFAPTSWKMRALRWTCIVLTLMSGRPRYAMASGRLPFRQATFPAAICKGKRMMIENTKEKRTLSTQIERRSRGLSLHFFYFLIFFLNAFLVETRKYGTFGYSTAVLVLVPFSLVYYHSPTNPYSKVIVLILEQV